MGGMPRVSDDHLAARRRQIIEAARRAFLRDGFHNTSMQDVIAEAGLSVGAVYRYFKSKNDIITEIAEEVVGGAAAMFESLAERDPPLAPIDAYERALEYVDTQIGADGAFRLALPVWAEALRDPALGAFVSRKYAQMRGHFAVLAARAQAAGKLAPDADPEAVGAVLFGLIPGYALQRVLSDGPDRAAFLAGVRALLNADARSLTVDLARMPRS
jgi:AcrR family transcriptional regulator